MRSHEAMDAVQGIGGDAAAVAQPRGELAVIDGAPAERGFGKSGVAAVVRDFLEELLCVHSEYRPCGPALRRFPCAQPALDGLISPTRDVLLGNQAVGRRSTTKPPTCGVGNLVGNRLLIIEAMLLSLLRRRIAKFVSVYVTCSTESTRP